MSDKMTKEDCLLVLCTKAAEISRLPTKADFTEEEVARIKSYFGPWPRALEAAGLKPAKTEDRLEKNHQKHIRAKQRKVDALKKLKQ
ncbi:MAG: hypothetical protein PHF63_04795 [Herbinix sp.]|nr:hypothetical protein [Herbinix sp.]